MGIRLRRHQTPLISYLLRKKKTREYNNYYIHIPVIRLHASSAGLSAVGANPAIVRQKRSADTHAQTRRTL